MLPNSSMSVAPGSGERADQQKRRSQKPDGAEANCKRETDCTHVDGPESPEIECRRRQSSGDRGHERRQQLGDPSSGSTEWKNTAYNESGCSAEDPRKGADHHF